MERSTINSRSPLPANNWSPDSSHFIYTEWVDTTGNGGADTLELRAAVADGSTTQQLGTLPLFGETGDIGIFQTSGFSIFRPVLVLELARTLRGSLGVYSSGIFTEAPASGLWVANADWSNLVKVAEIPSDKVSKWSTDGSYIGYIAPDVSGVVTKWNDESPDPPNAMWIANADGSSAPYRGKRRSQRVHLPVFGSQSSTRVLPHQRTLDR